MGYLTASRLETEQDSDEHHGDAQTERPPHHGFSSSVLVEEECREERANEEHGVNHSGQDQCKVSFYANVELQDRCDVIANDFVSGQTSGVK